MISYVTLGVNDLHAAKKFYSEILALMDVQPLYEMERMIMFAQGGQEPRLAICTPYNKEPATGGNGTMVALKVGSKELVNQIFARALELGATSGGEPGQRVPQFYGAYIYDLDNNKLAFFYPG